MGIFEILVILGLLVLKIYYQLRRYATAQTKTKQELIEINGKNETKSLKELPGIPLWTLLLMWWRFITFAKYIGSLGSIVQINKWKWRVAIINDYELGKELFKNPIFCGKRISEIFHVYSHGSYGLATTEGKEWKEQIRFCHQHLKEFGFGTKAMETFIQNEIDDVIQSWKAKKGECFSPNKSFYVPVLNSLWVILMGERASTEDPEILPLLYRVYECVKRMADFPDFALFISKVSIETAVKFQKWIPMFSALLEMQQSTNDLRDHFRKKIDGRKARGLREQPTNLVDAYLKQIEEATDLTSGFYGITGNLNLLAIMTDFFIAGGDTTANQLAWALLHLIRHPDIQEEIRREVHSAVGFDRRSSLQDKTKCPFTQAFILEVLRFTPIAPLGLPHATTEDTCIGPYFIQKETVVVLNIYNFHHDPQIWGDPQNFRPQRFLSEDGRKLRNTELISAFSLGLRRCLGEQLARDTLFLYVSSLCQEFVLRPDPSLNGVQPPLREQRSALYTPEKFHIMATPAPPLYELHSGP